MSPKRFIFILAIISAIIGGTDYLANQYSLYYEISWLDLLVHGLAGVWVSFVVIVFYFVLGRSRLFSQKYFFWTTLVAVLVIASLWEVLEYAWGVSLAGGASYWSDTSSDILMGFLGALSGYLFLLRTYKNRFI